MQTIWKFPSIGNVLAVLAISTSLLTGCFEEDEKKTKQPQSQNESVSELIEQVASIEAPVAPQNPLEQQDWTSDFLKPGDEVSPEAKPIGIPSIGEENTQSGDSSTDSHTVQTDWCLPMRGKYVQVTREYMVENWSDYPKTGHHPGTDYVLSSKGDAVLQFCGHGQVVDRGEFDNQTRYPLAKWLGNYFFLYVPSIDRTFLYSHLKESPPKLGPANAGKACGIAGETGYSHGVHLHFECWIGRVTSADRRNVVNMVETQGISALIAATRDPHCVLTHHIQDKSGTPDCSWRKPTPRLGLGTSKTVGTGSLLDALKSDNTETK